MNLCEFLEGVETKAENVSKRRKKVLGVGVSGIGEVLQGGGGQDGREGDVILCLLIRVQDEGGIVIRTRKLSRFQVGSTDNKFGQLRFSLITDIFLDGGVQM